MYNKQTKRKVFSGVATFISRESQQLRKNTFRQHLYDHYPATLNTSLFLLNNTTGKYWTTIYIWMGGKGLEFHPQIQNLTSLNPKNLVFFLNWVERLRKGTFILTFVSAYMEF